MFKIVVILSPSPSYFRSLNTYTYINSWGLEQVMNVQYHRYLGSKLALYGSLNTYNK